MSWFDTWFAKKSKQAWESSRKERNEIHVIPKDTITSSSDVDIEGLRFSVMPATGGTIVQIKHYDRKQDRSNTITHVIPDGENIAERVGQIVSLELLRA